jgi:hypothetical protein
MRAFLVTLLLLATPALAVTVGGKLWVKTKDTKVRKTPDLKGAALITVQPGKEVIWLGASAKNKEWHEVSVDGKKGFIFRSDLTPHAPVAEIAESTGKPINPQAFAASGAGYTKCSFGAAPQRPIAGSPAERETMAELIYLEELNREQASVAALDAKHKELHSIP